MYVEYEVKIPNIHYSIFYFFSKKMNLRFLIIRFLKEIHVYM